MNILTLIVYILLILKVNKLDKKIKALEQMLIDTDIDEDFWGEENETEKI